MQQRKLVEVADDALSLAKERGDAKRHRGLERIHRAKGTGSGQLGAVVLLNTGFDIAGALCAYACWERQHRQKCTSTLKGARDTHVQSKKAKPLVLVGSAVPAGIAGFIISVRHAASPIPVTRRTKRLRFSEPWGWG